MVGKLQKAIADNTRRMRKARKIYQVDLAAVLNVSRTFISDVENHRRAYNLEHINKIALYYECNLHDIIPKKPIA